MHIPDGMLPAQVCIAGYAGTAFLTWFSLKKAVKAEIDPAKIVPRASVMAAAFFVVSWIHIPIPPVSVHPILAGLMGILLGWISFPAILIGLFFQAAMFGHGGFTTLGVNALNIGGSALIAMGIFKMLKGRKREVTSLVPGFVAGFSGVFFAVAFTSAILVFTIPEHINSEIEISSIIALTLAHIPMALIEGFFTTFVIRFIAKVKPDMLL